MNEKELAKKIVEMEIKEYEHKKAQEHIKNCEKCKNETNN